jgi:hypothetical protein
MDIVLKRDDPRLGSYEPSGAIEKWPEQDVFGAEYERQHATIQRVGTGFVVIPPDQGRNINSVTIENDTSFKSQQARTSTSKMTEDAEVKG